MTNNRPKAAYYEVTVGNIGTVAEGGSRRLAERIYRQHVKASKLPYGRAAGESVVLLMVHYGSVSILEEYIGTREAPIVPGYTSRGARMLQRAAKRSKAEPIIGKD
jgi:hypothetical protein